MQIIYGLLKDAGDSSLYLSPSQGQYRNVPVSVAAYNLKSSVLLQKSFYRNESPLKLYWRIVSHFSYKVSFFFKYRFL
jgi:hypothetical protein